VREAAQQLISLIAAPQKVPLTQQTKVSETLLIIGLIGTGLVLESDNVDESINSLFGEFEMIAELHPGMSPGSIQPFVRPPQPSKLRRGSRPARWRPCRTRHPVQSSGSFVQSSTKPCAIHADNIGGQQGPCCSGWMEPNEPRSDETSPGGHAHIDWKTTMNSMFLTFAAVLSIALGTALLSLAVQTARA
jgi:hypothetical protein